MKKKDLITLAIVLGGIFVLLAAGLLNAQEEDPLSAQQVASDESQFITIPFEGTDGIDIHYITNESESTDEKPTFVLLHGSLFNAFTWNEVMDFFSERGRVIAYDQIPYGLSEKLVSGDWTEGNPYTSEAAVEQLFSFLDALNEDNVILVGNSYGGVLATQATLAQPERVDALIFVDAAVYFQEEMPTEEMPAMELSQVREFGQSEDFMRQTYLNPELISDDRMSLTMIHTQVEDWDIALWEYMRVWGVDTPDFAARIPEIQQPALVITGDSDAIIPVTDSQRLDTELPNSELAILETCGHVPQEECPELLLEAVDPWLSQLE